MGEEELSWRKKEMTSIFIVRDEFNHGSKWEVVIGTEKHHCKDENEVIDLIRQALSKKSSQELTAVGEENIAQDHNDDSFGGRPQDPAAESEEIYAQGGWGD